MPAERDGFWFDAPDASLALKRSGNQVSLAQAVPPWIVVDQSLATVIIGSRWPGRLWRVRVTQLGDMSGLVAQPGYWRAAAIELREELPLSALFGPQGEAVVGLLTQLRSLSRGQAEQLAAGLPPQAGQAYGRAWARWSEAVDAGHSATTDDAESAQAWRGVLAATRGPTKERSPIHSGFQLVHTLLRDRAQALDGDDAFVLIDDNGDTEQVLAPMWSGASDACLYAAMALGGARWVTDDEAAVLTQAWRGVFHGSVDAPAAGR